MSDPLPQRGKRGVADPQPGEVYRDKQTGETFEVHSYDRSRAYVYGVRSDYGQWDVFRPNFDLFYERVDR